MTGRAASGADDTDARDVAARARPRLDDPRASSSRDIPPLRLRMRSPAASVDAELRTARERLRAPRAAAIAGILFSVLLLTSFALLRAAVPDDPLEAGAWLRTHGRSVALALNLVPFAGVAFLWFIGVLRDRLGTREDRFFATVFLGSGILFLAMLFLSASVMGGLILAFGAMPALVDSPTFTITRAISWEIMNLYAIRMAGVFMMSTATLALRTGFIARPIALLGFPLALVLLLADRAMSASLVVFPLWVLLISVHVLLRNLLEPADGAGDAAG